ncbi:hypothetical protein FOA52_000794 [Chlamydomonas sp. UWO 241]|nr:hypothetical protein FOA52_000794 [Chlamydomonas sp. UWO 241]
MDVEGGHGGGSDGAAPGSQTQHTEGSAVHVPHGGESPMHRGSGDLEADSVSSHGDLPTPLRNDPLAMLQSIRRKLMRYSLDGIFGGGGDNGGGRRRRRPCRREPGDPFVISGGGSPLESHDEGRAEASGAGGARRGDGGGGAPREGGGDPVVAVLLGGVGPGSAVAAGQADGARASGSGGGGARRALLARLGFQRSSVALDETGFAAGSEDQSTTEDGPAVAPGDAPTTPSVLASWAASARAVVDVEVLAMVGATAVYMADLGLGIEVVVTLWRAYAGGAPGSAARNLDAAAGVGTVLVALPLLVSAALLGAVLWQRHARVLTSAFPFLRWLGLGASQPAGQPLGLESPRLSGELEAGRGPLWLGQTGGGGSIVREGKSASARISAALSGHASPSLGEADASSRAPSRSESEPPRGAPRGWRRAAALCALVAASPLLLLLLLLLLLGCVVVLDVAALIGPVVLHQLRLRPSPDARWRNRVVSAEVVLRQHRACRGPVHGLLESLPMTVMQAALLGTLTRWSVSTAHDERLLGGALAVSLLAAGAAAAELAWAKRSAKVRIKRAIEICVRYQGNSVAPLEWAERVAPSKSSVVLNMADPAFGALHRLQKVQLLAQALSNRRRVVISNSPASAVIASSYAVATTRAYLQRTASGLADAGTPARRPPFARPAAVRQATLLVPTCDSLRRLAELLPVALSHSVDGALGGGEQGPDMQGDALEPPSTEIQLSLVTLHEGLSHGNYRHLLRLLRTLLPLRMSTLVVKDTHMHSECVQVLCEGLSSPSCSLHTLVLSETQMTSTSLNMLCAAMTENTCVRSLDLSCGRLGAGNASALRSMLAANGGLRELSLPYLGMGSDEAGEVLLGALCSTTLLRLDLSQNHLKDDVPLIHLGSLLGSPPAHPAPDARAPPALEGAAGEGCGAEAGTGAAPNDSCGQSGGGGGFHRAAAPAAAATLSRVGSAGTGDIVSDSAGGGGGGGDIANDSPGGGGGVSSTVWWPLQPTTGGRAASAAPSAPLPPSSLRHLDLSFNWIQEGTATWLLLCLELFPRLTRLSMNHNNYAGVPGTPHTLSRAGSGVPGMYPPTDVGIGNIGCAMMDGSNLARDRGTSLVAHLLLFPHTRVPGASLMQRVAGLKVFESC